MTKDEFAYLDCVKGLDDIQLGMLWPSNVVKDAATTRDRLAAKRYVLVRDEDHPSGEEVVYLTSRGLRAWRRHMKRVGSQQEKDND